MYYEKEITVEVDCDLKELIKLLLSYNFKEKENYEVEDTYMIDKNYNKKEDYLDILKHTVLLRNIIDKDKVRKTITYKKKEYNEKKEIIKQGKIDCEVKSITKAKELLEAINYEELIKIHDKLTVYANDVTEIVLQQVNDKHIYIEMEEDCHYIDRHYNTIEEMINDLKKYNIPIKNEDFFVKKAEIELKESLEKGR